MIKKIKAKLKINYLNLKYNSIINLKFLLNSKQYLIYNHK